MRRPTRPAVLLPQRRPGSRRFPWGSAGGGGNVLLQASFAAAFADASPVGRSVTPVNGAAVTGGAAVFDGVNDYLNLGGFADFALGTRNFIFEFEALRTVTGANQVVLTTATDGSASGGWWVQFDGTGFSFYAPGSSRIVGAASVEGADGVWHKWGVQRSGNTFTLRKDNAVIATAASAVSLPASRASVGGTDSFSGFPPWFQGQMRNMVLTADTP